MKRKLFIISLLFLIFSCGNAVNEKEKDNLLKGTVENEKVDKDKETVKKEEEKSIKGKRMGDKETGYITLADNWEIVHRQEGEIEVIVFSNRDRDTEYITLMKNTTNVHDYNSASLAAYEKMTRNEEEAKYVKEPKKIKFHGREAVQLMVETPKETVIKNYIEHNGKVYILEVAGPQDNIMNLYDIIDKTWDPDR